MLKEFHCIQYWLVIVIMRGHDVIHTQTQTVKDCLINDHTSQVCNKLDDDAQSELAGIVSQKVKEEGLTEMVDTGVSFESEPNKDHIIGEWSEKPEMSLMGHLQIVQTRIERHCLKTGDLPPASHSPE